MNGTVDAYLAIGANLGDRWGNVRKAVRILSHSDRVVVDPAGIASLYETQPLGGPPGQQKYLNSAVRIRTPLNPRDLMATLMEVERTLGRTREVPWESRVMDIDLLLFGDLVCSEPYLTIPHPRLHQRRFVLDPLAEIAADVVHPVLGLTIAQLASRLQASSDQQVVKVTDTDWLVA